MSKNKTKTKGKDSNIEQGVEATISTKTKANASKPCTEKGLCDLDKWEKKGINECCPLMLTTLFSSTSSGPNIDADLFPRLFKRIYWPTTSPAPNSYGIAGEASLPLVRELTAWAFYQALVYLSNENQLISPNSVTMNGDQLSVTLQPDKKPTFQISPNLYEIFSKNRKSITNENVYLQDQNMVKILAFLNYLYKEKQNTAIGSTINRIIYYLGLISCAKPVLDIGALYAILEATFNYNRSVNYLPEQLDARNMYIEQKINDNDFENFKKDYPQPSFLASPRNAVLETADGAAASIAGRYFTVLSDTSAEIARHVPFMTVDKRFRYIILLGNSLNSNINNPTILKIIKKIKLIKSFDEEIMTTDNATKNIVIDLFYSILIDMENTQFFNEETCIDLLPDMINISVIKQEKIYFDLFSVAKFLYLSSTKGLDGMKNLLMSCNYDSQCHDNKDCKYYRLVCIYYFILFCGDNVVNSFKDITGIDLDAITISENNIDSLKEKYVTFYHADGKKSATKADLFDNIDKYTDKLLVNFDDKKKFIFYWLANKDWDDIEGMLQNWKHHLCDLVFSDGDDKYVHIVKPLLVNPKTGIISITDITTEMSTDLNSKVGASLIPWYSNISVDLTTSWSTTVILDIKKATQNTSTVMFTPVTEVDAASCRLYSTAEFREEPISMPLIQLEDFSLGFVFHRSTIKRDLSIRIVPQLKTSNPVLNSQIIFLNNIKPSSIDDAKIIFKRFTTIVDFLERGNFEKIFEKIQTKLDPCEKNMLQKIYNNIVDNTALEKYKEFFEIIKKLHRSTDNFANSNKTPTIVSVLTQISDFGDELKQFFGINPEPGKPPNNPTQINMALYNAYFPYLNVVINAFATNKNYKNLTARVTELIGSLKRGEPDKGEEGEEAAVDTLEEDSRKAKRLKPVTEFTYPKVDFSMGIATPITKKTETRKGRNVRKGGAPLPCDVLLSDIVGPYGIFIYTTENGTYNSKPINSLDDIYKLNKMYNKMYSISERLQYPENSVTPSQPDIIRENIPGTGKGLDTMPTENQEKNFQIIKSQWPNATDESIRSLILSVPNIQDSCKEVQDIYISRMTSFLRKKGMDEKLACYIALNKNRLKLIPVTDRTVQRSAQPSSQPITAKPISDEENLRVLNEQYAKSFAQRQEYFKKFDEESKKREAANIAAMKVSTPQSQSQIMTKRGGKFITRKRRFNKLTRKKRKQIKARKTHNKAKKHRYTRHK